MFINDVKSKVLEMANNREIPENHLAFNEISDTATFFSVFDRPYEEWLKMLSSKTTQGSGLLSKTDSMEIFNEKIKAAFDRVKH